MLLALTLAAATPNMLLVCEGATVAEVAESTTTAAVLDNRGNTAVGRAVTSSPQAIPFAVRFEIEDGEPTLALPDRRYKVRDLSITDRRITGKVRYNFLSSSRFEIDRVTGTMSSENGFQGRCKPVDTAARAF